jgi:hypothetical protein
MHDRLRAAHDKLQSAVEEMTGSRCWKWHPSSTATASTTI